MLPKQYRQIIDAAYAEMPGPHWSDEQNKRLIKRSQTLLADKVAEGDSPRYALRCVFVFHSPEGDPGRADWFMGLAERKARELHVDLDDRAPFEKSLSAPSLSIGSAVHHVVEQAKSEFGPK